jgi:hypothetical protein
MVRRGAINGFVSTGNRMLIYRGRLAATAAIFSPLDNRLPQPDGQRRNPRPITTLQYEL